MNATNTGNIPLSGNLSLHAKKSHIFYGLNSASLISLVQLCDNECITILDKNEINVVKYSKLVLKGHRKKADGLCCTPISRPLRHIDHAIITRDKTKTEIIQYLHVCCFGPIPRDFLKEIKNGNFLPWPGLNNKKLLRHLPPRIETALGRLDKERKNIQSKKQFKS